MATIPKNPKCSFSIPFKGVTPEMLFQITRRKVQESGGSMVGTAQNGTIRITDPVEGVMVYQVRGNVLDVFVAEKPFAVPCFTIQSKMEDGVDAAIEESDRLIAVQASKDDDEEGDEVDMGPAPDVTPSQSPIPGPFAQPAPDDSAGPRPTSDSLQQPSVIVPTAVLQRRLIAAGAPEDPRLTDGRFGPFTRATAELILRKEGFPDVVVESANGGKKARIIPPAAAKRLEQIGEKADGRKRLIFASLAGIVVITGIVLLRRRAAKGS